MHQLTATLSHQWEELCHAAWRRLQEVDLWRADTHFSLLIFRQPVQSLTGLKLSQTRCHDWKCPIVGVRVLSMVWLYTSPTSSHYWWGEKKVHSLSAFGIVESNGDYSAVINVVPVHNIKSSSASISPILRPLIYLVQQICIFQVKLASQKKRKKQQHCTK